MSIKVKILSEGKKKKQHYTKQEKETLNKARKDYYLIPKDKLKEWCNSAGYYTADEILDFINRIQKATSGT